MDAATGTEAVAGAAQIHAAEAARKCGAAMAVHHRTLTVEELIP